MSNNLILGKTQTTNENKIVTKEKFQKGIRQITCLDEIILPYDEQIVEKTNKGTTISQEYFAQVLKTLVEDIDPQRFPKGFYQEAQCDNGNLTIHVNMSPSIFQHAYTIYASTKDQARTISRVDIQAVPHKFKGLLESRGLFPQTNKQGVLMPTKNISIIQWPSTVKLITPTFMQQYSNQITPFLQALLQQTPLFIPQKLFVENQKEFPNLNKGKQPCLRLKDNNIQTIKEAQKISKIYEQFLEKHEQDITYILSELAKKEKEGIQTTNLQKYKHDFLYENLNHINNNIQKLYTKIPLQKELQKIISYK